MFWNWLLCPKHFLVEVVVAAGRRESAFGDGSIGVVVDEVFSSDHESLPLDNNYTRKVPEAKRMDHDREVVAVESNGQMDPSSPDNDIRCSSRNHRRHPLARRCHRRIEVPRCEIG